MVNEYVLSRVAHESFIPEGTYMGAESVKLKIPIELGGVNPTETPQYEQMPTFATNGPRGKVIFVAGQNKRF